MILNRNDGHTLKPHIESNFSMPELLQYFESANTAFETQQDTTRLQA